jgi:hypothetical protein
LHNNASARLNLDAFSASITVNDDAKANLSGTVNEYDLKYNHEENVNCKDLVAVHVSKKQTLAIVAAKEFSLADL